MLNDLRMCTKGTGYCWDCHRITCPGQPTCCLQTSLPVSLIRLLGIGHYVLCGSVSKSLFAAGIVYVTLRSPTAS